MSRPKKPAELKIAQGTFQPCRDGKRHSAVSPQGEPKPTRNLTGEGKKHWDRVVPELTRLGVATALDSESLTTMCDLWVLTQACLQLVAKDPTDKDYRCSYLAYSKAWMSLASKFGLNPSDRAKLQPEKSMTPTNPLEALRSKRKPS